eukprot:5197909-Pyramimonas_sp.AAC.1
MASPPVRTATQRHLYGITTSAHSHTQRHLHGISSAPVLQATQRNNVIRHQYTDRAPGQIPPLR